MAYIMNMAKHPLPQPFNPTEEQREALAQYQRRAHLQYSVPEKGITALTSADRKAMNEMEYADRMSVAPMWNGYAFTFTKNGEQGSLFEVEDNVANHLTSKYQGIIIEVTEESQIPKGVTPIRRMNPGKATVVLGRIGKNDAIADAREQGNPRPRGVEVMTKGIIHEGGVNPA